MIGSSAFMYTSFLIAREPLRGPFNNAEMSKAALESLTYNTAAEFA